MLLHVGGDAFVALAAHAGRPLHRRALADLGLPLGADLRQVVGEDERGARAVGAVHDGDVAASGSFTPRVQRGDRRVVPLGDLAEVDVGEHRAGQLELARADALDVARPARRRRSRSGTGPGRPSRAPRPSAACRRRRSRRSSRVICLMPPPEPIDW